MILDFGYIGKYIVVFYYIKKNVLQSNELDFENEISIILAKAALLIYLTMNIL